MGRGPCMGDVFSHLIVSCSSPINISHWSFRNFPESFGKWKTPPVTFSSKQRQAGWSTSSQARERRKINLPSSAPDFTHSVFHGCKFWDWNTFLSSPVFEQYIGIYEPKAPSFRIFDPRGVTRINFTWQLVNFGPITVEIELVKPIKFTLLQPVNHAPSDHHWLFYHVYERFNFAKWKLMAGL